MPTVAYALDMAAGMGVRIVLNPAPAQAVPNGLCSKATVLTPNETEAEFLSGVPFTSRESAEQRGDTWESEASARMLGMGPQAVVITLGQRGAYLATADEGRFIPAYRVSAVDVTAAGDAFNGALAVALAENQSMEQAIRFANAAGALAATRAGAQPSLAGRSEVENFLHRAVTFC